MKKILKELLWLVLSFLGSLILSFFFLELLKLTSFGDQLNEVEKLFIIQLYFIGCLVSIICIYIIRLLVSVIKNKFN